MEVAMKLARVLLGLCIFAVAACDGGAETPTSPSNPTPISPLAPTPRPGPVLGGPTGAYIVTLTASSSCDFVRDSVSREVLPFPDAVKVRRYEGEFANGEGRLTAADSNGAYVGGIDHYIYNGQPLMFVTGTELTIISPGDTSGRFGTCSGGDYWWEVLRGLPGEENFFELCGVWRGSMANAARIDGTIDGAFVFHQGYAFNKRVNQFCTASHRFTMVRR
jgi:hypothetical protein